MNRSSLIQSNSTLTSDLPLHSLNSNTMQQQRQQRRHNHRLSSSIIDSHLVNLYGQLAALEQQQQQQHSNSSSIDSNRLKSLLENYHYNCLQLKARYKIEEERIDRRFDLETRCTRAHFAAKKSELKELLLDRLRRKRKLVVDEMRSAIDIHSRSFDVDPLLVTMQPPHPLQAKAYNFRQRPDIGQQTSSSSNINDDEFSTLLTMTNIGTSGILSPMPHQQAARKRLVGAFSIFQLPKWTVKDDECEDDLRLILNSRK
ncbi:unnamed protein product [Rotaria sordida]|uniref:Uncharacterized protein n=1 Tax=Rotaria sordida TaxID=392033 RepID=A0A814EC33_9BILA|nr:unnamed protein product [Rotaria sordida]CAF1122437.1 unnamed protein product [Rotaria sordida]